MNRRFSLSFAWFGLLGALGASQSGCSLLFNLNDTQCNVTADCRALGPQFSNTLCVNRVCVASSGSAGAAGSGGAGGSAGMSGSGGATAGACSSQSECSNNADCIAKHVNEPYVCKDCSCVQLVTTDCPVLLPSKNTIPLLKTGSPIVLGAYANVSNPQDPYNSQAVINWDLALDEFDSYPTGGIMIGSTARPLLALVCNSVAADVKPSLLHLTQDVGAYALLTALATDRLYTAVTYTLSPEYQAIHPDPVFFLSALDADLRLAGLADNGMAWHMLGDPRVLAATTAALLQRMAPYVNAQRQAAFDNGLTTEDPSTPLRVTLVHSDEATVTDLFSVLTTSDPKHPETLLTFNGKPAIDQLAGVGDGSFREASIQSSKNHATPDVSAAISELESNPPHIVVAMATAEFPGKVIPAVENSWDGGAATAGHMRPFYLMSQLIYDTPELLSAASGLATVKPPLDQRVTGVAYAQAQDQHSKDLYNAYQGRLQSFYKGSLPLGGNENFYDAAYSLAYATAAASFARNDANATDVRDGLEQRVFSTDSDADSVDVGPVPVSNGSIGKFANLKYLMSLYGTMGPPNFDRTTGTRISPTSAWCIQPASASSWAYQADGLIYDPASRLFTVPSAGTPPCLAAY